MKKILKTIVLTSFAFLMFATSVSAYNTKFDFVLTSGWLSHWAYGGLKSKVTNSENPVVRVYQTDPSSASFNYSVFNSNNERRTNEISRTGTFSTYRFTNNLAEAGYMYKIGVKRTNGAWNSEYSSHGWWNPDEY